MDDIEQVPIPQELVEQVARGECVLLLGPDSGDSSSLDALTQALAIDCNYPSGDGALSLPDVATYYLGMSNPRQLVVRLREWVEKNAGRPTPLHHAVARLPIPCIVELSYDDRMKAALDEQRPYQLVVYDHELPYADRSEALLIKLYGKLDAPESLVLTEKAHYRLLSSDSHRLLIDQLRIWAATRALLWVDVDPTKSQWEDLRQKLTADISPRQRREVGLARSREMAEAWAECGVTPLMAPDPSSWLHALTQAVAEMSPPLTEKLPLPAPIQLLDRRPYKFLDFYTAEDADLFFGRERWIEELTGLILAEPAVVLLGRSGVGKTSLLLAGMLPCLETYGCLPIYARPGENPVAAIRAAVGERLSDADRAALSSVADLVDFIKAAGDRLGKTMVVALDQAEECFTALARPVRERWVKTLARALRSASEDVHWVLSLREDFAAELHDWTVQVPQLFDHTQQLTPLNREEARQAITRPLERVGVEIEEALVDRLLDDLEIEGVSPAQLQIVCDRLYRARDSDGRMTRTTHEALGGTLRILEEYVDEAVAFLPREQRETAVVLLKALVTGRETKLPLQTDEVLGGVAGDPAEKQAVLDGLVSARLVRSLTDEVSGERRYELMHDVVAKKVREWIDETEYEAKMARDLLRQGREAWRQLAEDGLLEREKLAYIHTQRENPHLRFDAGDLELILRAALHEGLPSGYWVYRAAEAGLTVWPILTPLLESKQKDERIRTLWALANWPANQALEALRIGMADDSPRVRVAAHQALYHVGSPEALAILDTSNDLRLVPGSEFTMGSDDGENNEKPVHTVRLEAYFAEKYPLTNEKYGRFIEAGGYEDAQYWTRVGWQWVQRALRTQPVFWQDEKWNQPKYPVVGVTWHEAWAYAHWAGRRLLTEAEWEKAASWEGRTGEQGNKGKKRKYPWGDEFDKSKCNTSESGIQHTTPVGLYSPTGGDSAYGCVDMAGNVWEWTSSLYRPYPYLASDGREDPEAQGIRVLRGGPWNNSENIARCTFRFTLRDSIPNYAYFNCGFRCGVVSRHSLVF